MSLLELEKVLEKRHPSYVSFPASFIKNVFPKINEKLKQLNG